MSERVFIIDWWLLSVRESGPSDGPAEEDPQGCSRVETSLDRDALIDEFVQATNIGNWDVSICVRELTKNPKIRTLSIGTVDRSAPVRAVLEEALDLRDRMAEVLFWDVKWSTVDECWDHCHHFEEGRAEATRLQRQIAEAEGRLPAYDWREAHPELASWYAAEFRARNERLAKMFVDLEH